MQLQNVLLTAWLHAVLSSPCAVDKHHTHIQHLFLLFSLVGRCVALKKLLFQTMVNHSMSFRLRFKSSVKRNGKSPKIIEIIVFLFAHQSFRLKNIGIIFFQVCQQSNRVIYHVDEESTCRIIHTVQLLTQINTLSEYIVCAVLIIKIQFAISNCARKRTRFIFSRPNTVAETKFSLLFYFRVFFFSLSCSFLFSILPQTLCNIEFFRGVL